jgi:serine/threonine-protein kinase
MTDRRIPDGMLRAIDADSYPSANVSSQDIVTEPGIPKPGELIAAKYEVERVLGIGGMGVVLAARHVQLGQRVAIKFMHAEAARDPSAAGRFLREARAAVALTSEHVTRVLDVGTLESGAPYMVMEYLAGVDLGDMLKERGPMEVVDAVGVILQACEAIAEAHAVGIVHRDLKPSNLFVSARRDGTTVIKVLDFGISKAVDFNTVGDAKNLTASGLVMGSPCYMSPEQVRSAKAVDARADIWALGAIAFELVTGARPFEGETLGETFARILSDATPTVRQYRPDVPAGFSSVVGQCLERRLEDRIQSVGDLASKLLPFGSPEMAGSVERIQRLCGLVLGAGNEIGRAGPMPGHAPILTPRSGGQPLSSRGAETGTPWHTSGKAPRPPPERRLLAWAVAIGVVVLAASAASVLAVTWRSTRGPMPVSAAPPGPSILVAPSSPMIQDSGASAAGLAPVALEAPSPAPPIPSDAEHEAVTKHTRSGPNGRPPRQLGRPVTPAPDALVIPAPPAPSPAPPTIPLTPPIAPAPPVAPVAPPPKPSPTPTEKDIF